MYMYICMVLINTELWQSPVKILVQGTLCCKDRYWQVLYMYVIKLVHQNSTCHVHTLQLNHQLTYNIISSGRKLEIKYHWLLNRSWFHARAHRRGWRDGPKPTIVNRGSPTVVYISQSGTYTQQLMTNGGSPLSDIPHQLAHTSNKRKLTCFYVFF